MDWIITGASRGIGRALTVALANRAGDDVRFFVVARDAERIRSIADEVGPRVAVVPIAADLSRLTESRAVGERLAALQPRPFVKLGRAKCLAASAFREARSCTTPRRPSRWASYRVH